MYRYNYILPLIYYSFYVNNALVQVGMRNVLRNANLFQRNISIRDVLIAGALLHHDSNLDKSHSRHWLSR